MKHKFKPILLNHVYAMKLDTNIKSMTHDLTLETPYVVPMFNKGIKYGQKYAVEMSGPGSDTLRRVEFDDVTPIYQTIDATPTEIRYISKMKVRNLVFMKVKNG